MQHDLSKKAAPPLALPKCPKCGGFRYTNCERAKTEGGDFLAIAFERGTACDCAAGREFAKDQMKWNRPDKIKHKRELSTSRQT